MERQVLIAALGNSMAGDDGVGEAILTRLQEQSLPASVHTIDLGSDSLGLLNEYEGEEVIVFVDAVDMEGLSAGEIVLMELSELGAGNSRSVHQLDPIEGIRLMAMTDTRLADAEVYVLGVQIAATEFGTGLSPQVAAAVPGATSQLRKLLLEKEIEID